MLRRYFQSERWVAGLILLLTPLYYVIPWGAAPDARSVMGIPFLLVYAIILPGFLLSTRIVPRPSDVLERITTTALLGLAGFMALAFIWALAGLPLGLLQIALPVVLVLAAAWSVVRPRARSRGTGIDPHRDAMSATVTPLREMQDKDAASLSSGEKILLAAFAVFLVGIFALVFRSGTPLMFTADTLDHVGYVAEIADTQSLFPTTAYYVDPGPNGADLRKGLLHVFYGFSSSYLHLDSLSVLTMMNAFLAILLLLSVYASARILFRNRAVAVLSSLLFLVALDQGLRDTGIRQSFYTQRFGIAFFLSVLAYGLVYFETGRRRDLVPAAIFAFAASAVHVFFGVLIGLAGLTILVWKCFFPQNRARGHLSRVIPLGIAVALGILPYGLYRYITANPGANELHKQIQGVVFITKHLYIADPIPVYRWFGLVGVLSFLAIVPLWKHRERHAGLGYVFASYLTLLVVLFNPILLPPVRGAMTYLIARLNVLCPFYFVAAYYLVAFCAHRHREFRSGVFRRVLAVLLAFAVLHSLIPVVRENAFSKSRVAREHAYSALLWKDALTAIDPMLPRGSVVASDPLTSYSVTAFTAYHTVCTFDQHAPPNDMLLEKRLQAARDILSPYVSIDRTTALLAEHRATHVIVNDRFPENVRIEYWSMNHEMFPAMRGKFDSHPEAFEEVYTEEGFIVFRWNGRQVEPDSSFSSPFILGAVPDGMTRVGRDAGEAVLEGFTLSEKNLSPGQPLDVGLVWSGRGEYRFRNYVVAVRFDHTNPGLPLGGKPFPKLARKIKEKLTGRSYRFSEFHKIRSGFLSPDTWRRGELALDETRLHIPPTAAAGEYTVSVKLLTLQHQPTYRLKDIFSDDDIYAGLPVGRITIR